MKELTEIIRWLIDHNQDSSWAEESANQILKVTEEAGEVAEAWIALRAQNPRKKNPEYHMTSLGARRVRNELFDVALTALVAADRFRPEPSENVWDDFQDHIRNVRRRIDE